MENKIDYRYILKCKQEDIDELVNACREVMKNWYVFLGDVSPTEREELIESGGSSGVQASRKMVERYGKG